MTENILIPSIEKRIGYLLEFNRQREQEADLKSRSRKPRPAITLSREFGCEGYPLAELLLEILKKKNRPGMGDY